MQDFCKRDIISLKQFSKEELLSLLKVISEFEAQKYSNILQGSIITTMFLEPSTRTRLSFVSAAQRLGGNIMSYESAAGTSFSKGETLRDTIKMLEKYSDLLVLRHPHEGAARFVAENIAIPVINAGDGSNQHPTQTLLDLYTIYKNRTTLENMKIGFLGDLKYGRTTHSLLEGLSYFGTEFYFISPDLLQMPQNYLDYLDSKNIKYHILKNYQDIVNQLDILYVTRIQKERFSDESDYDKVKDCYKISINDIENVQDHLMIMHPLPRVQEIDMSIDNTKHAFYFEQALNGVYTRQMLLSLCLNKVSL